MFCNWKGAMGKQFFRFSPTSFDRNSHKNLKTPTIATVFYSPPVGKKGFFKDMDNIMLEYVLPSFNDTFTPPLSLFLICIWEKTINSPKPSRNRSKAL